MPNPLSLQDVLEQNLLWSTLSETPHTETFLRAPATRRFRTKTAIELPLWDVIEQNLLWSALYDTFKDEKFYRAPFLRRFRKNTSKECPPWDILKQKFLWSSHFELFLNEKTWIKSRFYTKSRIYWLWAINDTK